MRRIEVEGGWVDIKEVHELTRKDQLALKKAWGFSAELDSAGKPILQGIRFTVEMEHDVNSVVYGRCIVAWSYGDPVDPEDMPLVAEQALTAELAPLKKMLGYEGPAPDGPDGDPKATPHSSSNGTSRGSAGHRKVSPATRSGR